MIYVTNNNDNNLGFLYSTCNDIAKVEMKHGRRVQGDKLYKQQISEIFLHYSKLYGFVFEFYLPILLLMSNNSVEYII